MSKTSFWDHPIEKLEEALHLKKQIHALQEKLSSLFSSDETPAADQAAPAAKVSKPRGGKRVFSAATRAKMAASQKARHARKLGSAAPAPKAAPANAAAGGKKRNLSAEGRARIVAALKARHAARRTGQK